MEVNLNLGEWNTVFSVPASVVDKHIKTAGSVYLKVMLVVLRNAGARLNTAQIADMISVNEDEVIEAIRYWTKAGIFAFGAEEGMRATSVNRISAKPVYVSTVEISKLMETKPELRFMFDRLEKLYGRPITSTEQRSYIYLYESAGLPADVLVMIVEHCISIEKTSIRYIEKTALGWADDGIDTHDKAVVRIQALSKQHRIENQVKTAFGINNRNLSANERKYIKTWNEEYHFDIEMIRLAYDRMVDGIGRLSFPYLNTILKSWSENQITTPDEVAEKDLPVRSVKKGKERSTSLDIEAFENLGLNVPEIEPEE